MAVASVPVVEGIVPEVEESERVVVENELGVVGSELVVVVGSELSVGVKTESVEATNI